MLLGRTGHRFLWPAGSKANADDKKRSSALQQLTVNRGPARPALLAESVDTLLEVGSLEQFGAHAAGEAPGLFPILTAGLADKPKSAPQTFRAQFGHGRRDLHGAAFQVGRLHGVV